MAIGPTEKYPDGKIRQDDEGEIKIGVALTPDGTTILTFGTSLQWLGLDEVTALQLAENIIKNINDHKLKRLAPISNKKH